MTQGKPNLPVSSIYFTRSYACVFKLILAIGMFREAILNESIGVPNICEPSFKTEPVTTGHQKLVEVSIRLTWSLRSFHW